MKTAFVAFATLAGFLWLLSVAFTTWLDWDHPVTQGDCWFVLTLAGVMAVLAIATKGER